MHHSKLLKTLRLLHEEEIKRLGKFLQSPFYNANANIVLCYRHLRKYYPDFDAPQLTREKVFQKLFPQRGYDHQKMLNLMSDFTALVEKFLWTMQVEREELQQQKLLLRTYAQRGNAYEAFVRQFQEINKKLEASPYKDATFYKEKFEIEQLYLNHPGTDKFKLTAEQYTDTMQHLDRYFVLEKLLLSCEMKAREIPLSEQHDIWMLEEIGKEQSSLALAMPIARAYIKILKLLETDDTDNYFELKTIFQNHLDTFTERELQNILASLLNYAIKKGNAGSVSYVRENFELYQIGIHQKLLYQNGLLNDRIYTNIALLASKLNEFDWCLQFLKEQENNLEESIRSDAKTYCLAYLYYGQKKYDEAIDYLNSIKFANDFYQLGARVLFLRTYSELFRKDQDFYDLLFTQTKSFEKYLRRNSSISKKKLTSHLDFVLILRQLIKLKMDRKLTKAIKSELQVKIGKKPVAYGNWLLEQVEIL